MKTMMIAMVMLLMSVLHKMTTHYRLAREKVERVIHDISKIGIYHGS